MFVFQVRDDGEVMGDFNPDDKTRFVSFIAKYASPSQKSSEESFDSVLRQKMHLLFLPAALRAAQACRYLIYSEAHFEVFRPAGATRCTDGGEIWHGGGDLLHARFHPHRCNDGCRTPKIEIFAQI